MIPQLASSANSVEIRKSDQTWNLDAKKLVLSLADNPDGLLIELDGKKPIVLRRREGRLAATIILKENPPGGNAAHAGALPR